MVQELKINRKSGTSPVSQIESFIKQKIVTEEILPGHRLPNTLEIVKAAGVSTSTVRQAMAKLEEAGYVTSTPGKGTFVSSSVARLLEGESGDARQLQINSVGVINAYSGQNSISGPWYRSQSITGINKQSNQFGSRVIIFEPSLSSRSYSYVYNAIKENGCDGVIWLYPENEQWPMTEKLIEAGVSVVVTRYSHGIDEIPGVEMNYENAGFEGCCELLENGCSKIRLFVVKETDHSSAIAVKYGCGPNNVEFGLARALRTFKGNGVKDIEIVELGVDYLRSSEILDKCLDSCGSETGLFFVDHLHMVSYLAHNGKTATDKLRQRHIISLNNKDTMSWLALCGMSLQGSHFMIPFEEIGALAVQKLANLVNGHMERTSTILKLTLSDTSVMDYSKESFLNYLKKKSNKI